MNKIKHYTKGDLTVNWDHSKCIHSENCWRGLSAVFRPKEKPWINVDGADGERIKQQIDNCPSGALSYSVEESNFEKTTGRQVEITVTKNGPLIVDGAIRILVDGAVREELDKTALCRCGHSENKPFCDGSHSRKNFKG